MQVLIVGFGFGEAFLPIYRAHPAVTRVGVVDPSPEARARAARAGVPDDCLHASLDEALAGPLWDIVHVLAPVSFHADYTVKVLESGRHCACAVPMATSFDDISRVLDAASRAVGVYMMMETSLFSAEYFVARDMLARGDLGTITYYRGEHIQNLDGYPEYWRGYPPMRYLTHALSPALGLTGGIVSAVSCQGSSQLKPHRVGAWGPGWATQAGLFQVRDAGDHADPDLVANITTSFFQVGRGFYEGFSVYGSRGSLEWPASWDEPMLRWDLDPFEGQRGRSATPTRVAAPPRPDLLPPQLQAFADGDHGGSHPHLVHELLQSVLTGRAPSIDAVRAAELVAPGIAADESSHRHGELVDVPRYR